MNLIERIGMRIRSIHSNATPKRVARYMRKHGTGTVRADTGPVVTGSGDPWMDVIVYLEVSVTADNGKRRVFVRPLFRQTNICFSSEVKDAKKRAYKIRDKFLKELRQLVPDFRETATPRKEKRGRMLLTA